MRKLIFLVLIFLMVRCAHKKPSPSEEISPDTRSAIVDFRAEPDILKKDVKLEYIWKATGYLEKEAGSHHYLPYISISVINKENTPVKATGVLSAVFIHGKEIWDKASFFKEADLQPGQSAVVDFVGMGGLSEIKDPTQANLKCVLFVSNIKRDTIVLQAKVLNENAGKSN